MEKTVENQMENWFIGFTGFDEVGAILNRKPSTIFSS